MYEPTTVQLNGKTHTSYLKAEILKTGHFAIEMIRVYEMRGKSISTKKLPELLKKETVALISSDPHAAEPLNLRLFKESTLLFVLPGTVGHSAFVSESNGPIPVAPPAPATRIPASPATGR
jgi:hypothetical protein